MASALIVTHSLFMSASLVAALLGVLALRCRLCSTATVSPTQRHIAIQAIAGLLMLLGAALPFFALDSLTWHGASGIAVVLTHVFVIAHTGFGASESMSNSSDAAATRWHGRLARIVWCAAVLVALQGAALLLPAAQ